MTAILMNAHKVEHYAMNINQWLTVIEQDRELHPQDVQALFCEIMCDLANRIKRGCM